MILNLGNVSPQCLVNKQWSPGCRVSQVATSVRFPDDEPHSPVPAGNVRRPTFGEVLDSSTALVSERTSTCHCLALSVPCISLCAHCLLLDSLAFAVPQTVAASTGAGAAGVGRGERHRRYHGRACGGRPRTLRRSAAGCRNWSVAAFALTFSLLWRCRCLDLPLHFHCICLDLPVHLP